MSEVGIETYHEDGKWKNRIAGNVRANSTFPTKADAVADGKRQARKYGTHHIVLNMDGSVASNTEYEKES